MGTQNRSETKPKSHKYLLDIYKNDLSDVLGTKWFIPECP